MEFKTKKDIFQKVGLRPKTFEECTISSLISKAYLGVIPYEYFVDQLVDSCVLTYTQAFKWPETLPIRMLKKQ